MIAHSDIIQAEEPVQSDDQILKFEGGSLVQVTYIRTHIKY